MTFTKFILTSILGFSIAATASAAPWSKGTSRGFDFHNIGSSHDGFKLVCDSDAERNGSFLELRATGVSVNTDREYRVEFGTRSFSVAPSPTLILLAKKLDDQDKSDLRAAYASSSIVRVFQGEEQLLELDLGSDRPALCL